MIILGNNIIIGDDQMSNVEKSQIKVYNTTTMYHIGGIRMDRITQSMIGAFKEDLVLCQDLAQNKMRSSAN